MNSLVHLDFVSRRAHSPLAGGLLLAIGLLAAGASAYGCYREMQTRKGLELRLDTLTQASRTNPADAARARREAAASDKTIHELATPWTTLLADLEAASKDVDGQVSVLSVEPDHAKHKVHIGGEAKNLALAIAYIRRLQLSGTMRYPMLDSHELKTDDPEHPVRFELSADWRDEL